MPPASLETIRAALLDALVQGDGMNDFLQRFLEAAGRAFGAPRVALYDYDETASIFDLLFFDGYPRGFRSDLRQRMSRLDVRRALEQREPYSPDASRTSLLVPLYFQDTLEAVLLLEADEDLDLDATGRAACALLSRFLGLFMSSRRLPVNRETERAAIGELRRAREVQQSYLPIAHPRTDRYELFGHNQSSAAVGGDYFGYFQPHERRVQGVVADACGHGLASALIMSHFRGLLRAELGHGADLASLFTRLSRQLHTGGDMLQYLTGVFFEYDEEAGDLRYFNAGHFDPLVIHEDGRDSTLPGGGPPMGMFRDSSYELHSARLSPGDLLVLFTDGLVELSNDRGDCFGVEGVRESARGHRDRSLKDLASALLSHAAQFSGHVPPQDDVTLFLMRVR